MTAPVATGSPAPKKKGFKWEPTAAMVLLVFLGAWLVIGARPRVSVPLRDGAVTAEIRVLESRGVLERVIGPDGSPTFRVILRDGYASDVMSLDDARKAYGPAAVDKLAEGQANVLFRLLNITSWASLAWVAVGFGGQFAFSGRMIIQWWVSEKRRESTVPATFWWWSLAGALMLFSYFVWRQDIVAVLGQSSGIVVYARNLRLIHKTRRRERRAAAAAASGG